MKKLLVIVCVFGTYQDYIPLFTVSWLRAYPEVEIRIYAKDKISADIYRQLEILEISDRVTIIEDAYRLIALDENALSYPQISKCFRWLIYEPVFEEYESIYIGDIDIIIAKEAYSLIDQHNMHCAYLNLPYSNILRINTDNVIAYSSKNILRFISNIKTNGLVDAIGTLTLSPKKQYRLSGLHYLKTVEYFTAVKPLIASFIEKLNKMGNGSNEYHDIRKFNNEELLYDLVKASGLGISENRQNGDPQMNITSVLELNPETSTFRPHHGLHLGIFRGRIPRRKEYASFLNRPIYQHYYKDFVELSKTDSYKAIEKYFSEFVKLQIDKVHAFYKV